MTRDKASTSPGGERGRTVAPDVRMPIAAKGHKAHFFSDPAIDKIQTMLLALVGEVSVLRDRLDAHERLAAAGVIATPAAVDAYVPDAQVDAERDFVRQEYMRRIFRVLLEEAERLKSGSEKDWEQTIQDVRADD